MKKITLSLVFVLLFSLCSVNILAQDKPTRDQLITIIDDEMSVGWDDMEEFWKIRHEDVKPSHYSQIYLDFFVNGITNEDPEDESLENAKLGDLRLVMVWSESLSQRDEALFKTGRGLEEIQNEKTYVGINEVMIKIGDKMHRFKIDPNSSDDQRDIVFVIKSLGLFKGHRRVEIHPIVINDDSMIEIVNELIQSEEGQVKVKYKGENFDSGSFEPDEDDLDMMKKTYQLYKMFEEFCKKETLE